MTANSDRTESANTADIEAVFRSAVESALISPDFATSFARFREALPGTAPGFAGRLPDDEDIRRSICFAIFREIWKVTPRPDQGWRPLPLAKSERNAPCLCGSGRKFKHCCGAAADLPSFLGSNLTVLGYVLERFPAAEFAALPFKQLDPEEVAHTAGQWMEQDRYDLAIPLLEALLTDPGKLDERHEWAFDLLGDGYLALDRPDDRTRLVEAMSQAPNLQLRVAALLRRCTMLADAGDYDAAWRLFREAQRVDPDNPSLAHLELVLLASQNEVEQLVARARFWAARLRKLGYGNEKIVELMDDIAHSPEGFIQAMNTQGPIVAVALTSLAVATESLPPPESHYRLQAMEDSAGPLEPEDALANIESEWRDISSSNAEYWDAWGNTGWVDWLVENPLAWQSFAILDDLAAAVDAFDTDDEMEEGMLDEIEVAVVDRAVDLLRLVIADNQATGLKLEWGWLQNRPALRLLERRIQLATSAEEEVELLEWLLALNPNDNQGIREPLIHVYCSMKRPADALAVCDRYPGDRLAGTAYGRVLALVLLDRRAEATAALVEAQKVLPKVLKTLVAARPKAPKQNPGYVTAGGDDEAWIYRLHWRPVWDATGALEWLKRAAGVKG